MNKYLEAQQIHEANYGVNYAFVLGEDEVLSETMYRVMQGQVNAGLIKCMKMRYNGCYQLYYMPGDLRPLNQAVSDTGRERFIIIVRNLISCIEEIENSIGFLPRQNIYISPKRVYLDVNTLKVRLTYLPLKNSLYPDDRTFENELKTMLISLIDTESSLSDFRRSGLMGNLKNSLLSISNIIGMQTEGGGDSGSEKLVGTVMLVSENTENKLELEINKPDYIIGRRKDVDGVVDCSMGIGRVHCKITSAGGKYYITDLQSKNGTLVNNEKLIGGEPRLLLKGDTVQIADVRFRVVIV